MENLLWLSLQFVVTTLGVLLSFRFGRRWLEVFLIICIAVNYPLTGKIVAVGPILLNSAQLLFAGVFLGTKILTEYYGAKAGYGFVKYTVFAAIVFVALSFTGLPLQSVPETAALAAALNEVFLFSGRVLVGGLLAFAVSQTVNVWVFSAVGVLTKGKHLWMRTNVSNIVSQVADSAVLMPLVFWGVHDNLLMLIAAGIGVKVLIGVLDTPVMYLTRFLKPKDITQQKEG